MCSGLTKLFWVLWMQMTGMSISESTGRVSTCASAPLQSCNRPFTEIGLWTAVYMLSASGVDTWNKNKTEEESICAGRGEIPKNQPNNSRTHGRAESRWRWCSMP